MKKITLLMTVLFAVAGIYGASAQEVTGQNIYTAPESKRAQNVFIEVLGQGLALTANYDTRFTNKRDGIGGRIGIGHYLHCDVLLLWNYRGGLRDYRAGPGK